MSASSSSSGDPRDATPPPAVGSTFLTHWGFPRLRTCPRCEYPLFGLPASYRCPECGLEYDEFSCEWVRVPPTLAETFKAEGWTVVLFSIFGVAHGVVFAGPLLLWVLTGLGVVAVIVMALVTLGHGRARHRRSFVALVPSGIHVKYWGCNEIIPWNADLRVRERYGRFLRGLQLDRQVLGVRTGLQLGHIIQGHENRVAFAQAIEEGRRRYAKPKQPLLPSTY